MFQLCILSTSQFWLLKLPLAVTCSNHLNVLAWAPHTHPNLCARERRINCSDRWKNPKAGTGRWTPNPRFVGFSKRKCPTGALHHQTHSSSRAGTRPCFSQGRFQQIRLFFLNRSCRRALETEGPLPRTPSKIPSLGENSPPEVWKCFTGEHGEIRQGKTPSLF